MHEDISLQIASSGEFWSKHDSEKQRNCKNIAIKLGTHIWICTCLWKNFFQTEFFEKQISGLTDAPLIPGESVRD